MTLNTPVIMDRPEHDRLMKPEDNSPDISIVIPIFNEEGNIFPLHEEITTAFEQISYNYEVIVVDDGSSDKSYEQLCRVYEQDQRWRIFRLRRNFGQTAALSAGFDAARGRVVITMDGDLQNDPMDIPKLMEKIEEGYDIVSGWRVDRKEPFFSRRLPSILANNLISRTTNVALHDYGCTLKAYRSEVVKNIKLYGELHRFIPALASWMGVYMTEIPVNDRARLHGTSKYGIGRTFRVILDLITVSFLLKFATKPLHVFGTLGGIMGTVGSLILLYLAFVRIVLIQGIADRPILILGALMVMLGVQMFSIGLVAEMIMRNYHEPEGRPTYMVREQLDDRQD